MAQEKLDSKWLKPMSFALMMAIFTIGYVPYMFAAARTIQFNPTCSTFRN